MNESVVTVEAQLMTVEEFCQRHRMSKPHFYKLVAEGKAPESQMLGHRRFISVEAASEWRKRMAAPTVVNPATSADRRKRRMAV